MSIWTHVVGIIRFDGIVINGKGTPFPDCDNVVDYDDDNEKWDKCNIPCGSEGSLNISYWENPDGHQLARWVVSIWGDLRDYSNEDEIIEYFNRITNKRSIRQACFTMYVEGGCERTFVFENEYNAFREKINVDFY